MINYLIVDDEPQARKLLQTYLSNIPKYQLVKSCSNAMEAYEALQTAKIDLMFLDIKMPLVSGTDFLRSLKNPPLVIFTTAFNKYAMEGYELNVIDYLLKPIALPRLLNAIEKVNDKVNTKKKEASAQVNEYLFIKNEGKWMKVSFTEILLVEGMQNFVKLHLANKILVASHTMKALEEMLPTDKFLRVNRSFIIPVNSIVAIDGNIVETTYKKVQIGISYRNEVMKIVK